MLKKRFSAKTRMIRLHQNKLFQLSQNKLYSYAAPYLTSEEIVFDIAPNANLENFTIHKNLVIFIEAGVGLRIYKFTQARKLEFLKTIKITEPLIDFYLEKSNLFLTTDEKQLYQFYLGKSDIYLEVVYQSSQPIKNLITIDGKAYFSGFQVLSEASLLPNLEIVNLESNIVVRLPNNMPAGNYNSILIDAHGQKSTKFNVFSVGRSKVNSKIDFELIRRNRR